MHMQIQRTVLHAAIFQSHHNTDITEQSRTRDRKCSNRGETTSGMLQAAFQRVVLQRTLLSCPSSSLSSHRT